MIRHPVKLAPAILAVIFAATTILSGRTALYLHRENDALRAAKPFTLSVAPVGDDLDGEAFPEPALPPAIPLGTITQDGFAMRDGTILRGDTSFRGDYRGLSIHLVPAISDDYDSGRGTTMSGWALFVDDDASTSTRTSSRLIHYSVFSSLGDFIENVDEEIREALAERVAEERRQRDQLSKFEETN